LGGLHLEAAESIFQLGGLVVEDVEGKMRLFGEEDKKTAVVNSLTTL